MKTGGRTGGTSLNWDRPLAVLPGGGGAPRLWRQKQIEKALFFLPIQPPVRCGEGEMAIECEDHQRVSLGRAPLSPAACFSPAEVPRQRMAAADRS